MEYIKVKNFEQLQHYKDRNPPWIKLYNSLLDDYEFACLQDASKLHLIGIWLLASRTDNKIPADPDWISKKINATEKVDLPSLLASGFLEKIPNNQELQSPEQDASNPLADRKQSACLETEREKRQRREKIPPKLEDVKAYCEERNNGIDPQKFIDHYEANGWMRGKTKIKSWKACIRTWESNGSTQSAPKEYGANAI